MKTLTPRYVKCLNCGDGFWGGSRSKWCPKCKGIVVKRQRRELWLKERSASRVCLNCGDGFNGSRQAKYCPRCRALLYPALQREGMERWKASRRAQVALHYEACMARLIEAMVRTCPGEDCSTCMVGEWCKNVEGSRYAAID
jgi:Zn finger protein HypA/HybF involved in hydrogenase expression